MKKLSEVPALLQQWQEASGVDLLADKDRVMAAYEQAHANQRTIFLKILAVAGGLVAATFFIFFVYGSGLDDHPAALLVLGGLLLGGALLIGNKFSSLLPDTLSVSAFAVAFLLIGIGMGDYGVKDTSIFAILSLLGMLALLITHHYLLAFLAVLVCAGSLFFIFPNGIFSTACLWLIALLAWAFVLLVSNEAAVVKHKKFGQIFQPICLGLIVTLVMACFMVRWMTKGQAQDWFMPASTLLVIGALLYAAPPIVRRLGIHSKRLERIILFCLLLLLLPTVFAPAISCSLLILLVCFAVRNHTGYVLGMAGLVYSISQFYYDLQLTLLAKSVLLLLPGILFLVLYFLIHKSFQQDEKL